MSCWIRAVGDVARQRQAVADAQLIAAIVEYSDDAIIGSTLDGIITSWNPAAERMYGYPSKEIIGKSGSLLVPEDRAEEFLATVAMVKEGKVVKRFETMRVRKDGSAVPVSLTVAPIYDEDGAIVGASAVHRDVTEQRRAFELAQRMKAIVESSDDAIIGRTLEGVITSWNPAAERMYGYSSEEIVGTSIDRLIPEAQMAEMAACVAKVRAGEHVERVETVRVRKDGTVFPVSITISPIRDEDGAIVGASAIHRDVSEQRRAFEVAQRMKAIVESSDDAIISVTLEAIITSWNPAAERMYGYSSEEIVGSSIDRLHPEGHECRAGSYRGQAQGRQACRAPRNCPCPKGRGGGPGLDHHLTAPRRGWRDRRRLCGPRNMTELQHAARYARSLIEAALDPLVTISPAGKITDVNEASIKVTGVPREALIGSDFSQYFTDPDKAREGYARAFAQGSLIDYPLTLVHQDGTLIDVLCNASVYRDVNGAVLGVLAVARDASKLRQQQQLSEQLQEALESRIVIEQAKGITAQRHGITIDQAYQRIRTHARNNNASLRAVAQAIVEVGLQV